jgi:hypothetical protein
MQRVWLSFVLLSLACIATAQGKTGVTRDTAALEVFANALAKSPELRNLTVDATLQSSDRRKRLALIIKLLDVNHVRSETDTGGTRRASVNKSGKTALYENGETKGGAPLWISTFQRQDVLPLVSVGKDLSDPSTSIAYIGIEEVNGRKAHHIRTWVNTLGDVDAATVERLSEFHVYLDTETFFVLKTRRNIFATDTYSNYSVFETSYSDYSFTSGFPIAHTIEHSVAGNKAAVITVSEVRQGTLNPQDFQ